MKPFKDAFGQHVDLDDESTYSNLPDNIKELNDLMYREIGYALTYMDYYHVETFKSKSGNTQRKRVKKLIADFARDRQDNYENKRWYKESIFIYKDETENMC